MEVIIEGDLLLLISDIKQSWTMPTNFSKITAYPVRKL